MDVNDIVLRIGRGLLIYSGIESEYDFSLFSRLYETYYSTLGGVLGDQRTVLYRDIILVLSWVLYPVATVCIFKFLFFLACLADATSYLFIVCPLYVVALFDPERVGPVLINSFWAGYLLIFTVPIVFQLVFNNRTYATYLLLYFLLRQHTVIGVKIVYTAVFLGILFLGDIKKVDYVLSAILGSLVQVYLTFLVLDRFLPIQMGQLMFNILTRPSAFDTIIEGKNPVRFFCLLFFHVYNVYSPYMGLGILHLAEPWANQYLFSQKALAYYADKNAVLR